MKRRITAFLILVLCLLSSITVFGNGADDKLKYSVDINLTHNQVMVYEKDINGEYTIPYKTFVCSVGEATPVGEFRTTDKYVWRYLFGDVYGQYATRITGHILFHSVPYFKQDKATLEYEEYNKLGTTASMGCIRLAVIDAKWLYDNCPSGTRVRMFRSDEKMPLEKPEGFKIDISDELRRNWDPTDPDLNNPWIGYEDLSELKEQGITKKQMDIYSAKQVDKKDIFFKNAGVYMKLSEITELLEINDIPTTPEITEDGLVLDFDKSFDVKAEDIQALKVLNEDSDINGVIMVINGKKTNSAVYKYKEETLVCLNTVCYMANLKLSYDNNNIYVSK